ncbi:hypothetical protein [Corynebacterium mastitidis]|uniref:hypothetical protein n=1 Tax=Corynebacterium mastitidis TaxID=161890 RepID=UPI00037AAAC3|nr:hypothetical protein [Corynebacterium mastitidis]
MALRDVSGFPVVDADRSDSDEWFGREVLCEFGMAEAYVPEVDSWRRLPLRLSHSQSAGIALEVGPYDFSESEFSDLEAAVRAMREVLDRNKG